MSHKITITIDTSNAAFEGNEEGEVSRILRNLSVCLEDGFRITELASGYKRPLFDRNGNRVGSVAGKGEDEIYASNVRVAEDPLTAVARGTGAVLEELDAVKDILERSEEDG